MEHTIEAPAPRGDVSTPTPAATHCCWGMARFWWAGVGLLALPAMIFLTLQKSGECFAVQTNTLLYGRPHTSAWITRACKRLLTQGSKIPPTTRAHYALHLGT